jgi:hypothetical protein
MLKYLSRFKVIKTRIDCNEFLFDFALILGYILKERWAVSSAWESATMALWRSPVRARYGPHKGQSI